MSYSSQSVQSLYALGRMYFEMGYFAPAERIFNGLAVVDEGATAARLGLALIKLERGLSEESLGHFRLALQQDGYQLETKMGLSLAFIEQGEFSRAKSVLLEVANEMSSAGVSEDIRLLYQALRSRCEER